MESEEPFGDEMPNFDTCGTYLRTSKTETAASSENSRRKSTFQLASDCHIITCTMFVVNNNCQFFKNQLLFCNLTNERC